MIKFHYIKTKNREQRNPNWPKITDDPYRILIIKGSESKKKLGNAFFLICGENSKLTERPANLHKASKETRDQAFSIDNSPSAILSKQTFEVRLVSQK